MAGEKVKPPENEVAWSKEMAAKDVEKVVVHYAVDGVLMAPGMAAAKGKDATHRDPSEPKIKKRVNDEGFLHQSTGCR